MTLTYAEVAAELSAPGQEFEIAEQVIHGVPIRVFVNGPQTLRDIFLSTTQHGDAPFLAYEHEHLTYAEHARLVAGLATYLQSTYGLKKGDRVVIAMRNYPEWVPIFFALQVLGVVVVPLNAWWTASELEYGLTDSAPVLVFADAERTALMMPTLANLGGVPVIEVRGDDNHTKVGHVEGAVRWSDVLAALDPDATLPDVEIDADDDATIMYTSGTTGKPKGAIGTHRNYVTNIRNGQFRLSVGAIRLGIGLELLALAPKGGSLIVFPFFHIAGLGGLTSVTANGGKLAMLYKWDPQEAMELIEREALTGVAGVPTVVRELLTHAADRPEALATVTGFAAGGAAVPADLVHRVDTVFKHQAIPTNGYGLTETTSAVVGNSGEDYFAHPDSVGIVMPGSDLRVVGADGNDVPEGEIGELWFRGPQIVRGYWNKPEATAEAFTDGWFHTGDLGKIEDGFVYVLDRIKDVIIRGGENIYCAEVEGVLYDHPSVGEVALIGIPDDKLGEIAIAVVVPQPGVTTNETELKEFVAQHLAGFKVPARILVQDEALPRTSTGKVLKRDMKAALVAEAVTA